MHRRLLHWVRATLPAPAWVGLFVVGVVLIEGLHLLAVVLSGHEFPPHDNPFTRVRVGLATISALAYGMSRVKRFHPLYTSEYRQWLEMTPWTIRHPLPCGPVRLVPQDAIVMGVLALAAYGIPEAVMGVPLVVTGAYLAMLAPSFFLLKRRHLGYATLLGLILAVRFSEEPLVAAGILFATYVLAAIGLQRSLAEFPWRDLPEFLQSTNWAEQMADQKGKGVVGWPWDLVNPRRTYLEIPFVDALWVGVLVGGAAHAADVTLVRLLQPRFPFPIGSAFLAYGVMGAVLTRLAVYVTSFAPALNVWGRLGTGRLILPSYDVVFVGPLLGVAAYATGLGAVALLGFQWGSVTAPLGAGLAAFFFLHTGPTQRRWELTHRHRMVPRGLTKTKFHEL